MNIHKDDMKNLTKVIKSPTFWNEQWQQELVAGSRKQQTEEETIRTNIRRWEKRAKPFASNVLGKKGSPRVKKITDWLLRQEVHMEGSCILDIGSGPGAFTIPFAKQANHVVALEPVKAMTDTLRSEITTYELDNVTIVEEPWETVSIEEKGWSRAFDLVFASMVPGINDLRTIEKAIACSKAYCYISSFAGKREYQGLQELWPILFQTEHPPFHLDIQYQLNLLYTKGYNFTFRVWEEKRNNEMTVEEASKELFHQLQLMADDQITETIKENEKKIADVIMEHVMSKAVGGSYKHKSVTRLGAILIDLRN